MGFDPLKTLREAFGETWIGAVVRWGIDNFPLLLGLVVLGVLLYVGYGVLVWTANGQGQVGIIEGYVGTIGAGKTTLAVQHALELARMRDAVLLSNVPVRCNADCRRASPEEYQADRAGAPATFAKGRPHCELEHRTLPMTDDGIDLGALTRTAFELRDAERGLVLLMDEVGVVMPARLWKDFSVALMWVLQQSRKLACEWVWTAQDPTFVDHQLRSLTSAVHYIKAYPPPSVWRRVRGKRPWVLVDTVYLPTDAPRAHGTAVEDKKDRRLSRSWSRYRRRWEGAFDTDAVVLPSRHLKGAEVLIEAVQGTKDEHVVLSSVTNWGELAHGAAEPDP